MSKLDGRYQLGEYTLVFNVNTLCDLEDTLGVADLNELMDVFNSLATKPSIRTIRTLFFGALKQEHEDMTPAKAGAIISEMGIDAATTALTEALELAFPDGEEVEGNAPGKKRGAGSKS